MDLDELPEVELHRQNHGIHTQHVILFIHLHTIAGIHVWVQPGMV